MAASKNTHFRADLKPLDALFFGDGEVEKNSIQLITLDNLSPFKDHPFKLYNDEKMQDMTASIAEHGVMTPLIVRPHPDGQTDHYEIISGHNRHEGARLAGLSEIPAIVREVDDATAILMMISSNFEQREELLPSEKAFAYKMQLEAISKQGQRSDLGIIGGTSRQGGEKLSVDLVSEATDESSRQIHRYVRLAELIPPLLERVDAKALPLLASVDLSYLTREEQASLDELLTVEGIKTVTNAQAVRMKEQSRDGVLDDLAIVRVLHDRPEPILASVKLTKRLQEYIPLNTLPKDAENLIMSAMDIRSTALCHLPEGVKEQDVPNVLAKALDAYAQMGLHRDASSDLEQESKSREDEEAMEI